MNIIDTAKKVIDIEIEGLKALEAVFDNGFEQLVNKIHNITEASTGRVILSGMGKSGHIANKIAATLASTGTPAFFVHPAEASHGDMGMIQKNDVVILLSNSGETAELKDIIYYCKRFDIFLSCMVRRKTSALVDASNIALILPDIEEANIVKAPTTSTTMMLALGDAIAVALLDLKGFKEGDFKLYHPGGNLGAAFLTVAELMHKADELPLVDESTPMQDVLLTITGRKFGTAGVVNNAGQLQGIITDGDLRRNMGKALLDKIASQVMTTDPTTIRPSALASEALGLMNKKLITALFVIDDNKPVGILHIHDILRAGVS